MNKTFFFGLLAGAVCGAIVGLLMAPTEGSDARRRISQAAKPVLRITGYATGFRRDVGESEVIKQAM